MWQILTATASFQKCKEKKEIGNFHFLLFQLLGVKNTFIVIHGNSKIGKIALGWVFVQNQHMNQRQRTSPGAEDSRDSQLRKEDASFKKKMGPAVFIHPNTPDAALGRISQENKTHSTHRSRLFCLYFYCCCYYNFPFSLWFSLFSLFFHLTILTVLNYHCIAHKYLTFHPFPSPVNST